MNYKYNEEEYGKLIYEKGFQSQFLKYETVVLVKYLKKLGKSKKDSEKFMYEFCKKYIPGFNKVKYYKVIDRALREGRKGKNPLMVIKDVPILKKELEYIDSLELDIEYKKLLFAFIVKRKLAYEIHKIHNAETIELSTYFNGAKKSFREVFKSANITKKGYKIDNMIINLVKEDVVESIIKGDLILKYMYNIYNTETYVVQKKNHLTYEMEDVERKRILYKFDEDEVFERIKDFDNIGYIFEYYKGDKKIKKCEECGKLIKFKSKKTPKYCKACAIDVDRKKALKRWESKKIT